VVRLNVEHTLSLLVLLPAALLQPQFLQKIHQHKVYNFDTRHGRLVTCVQSLVRETLDKQDEASQDRI
jgi:hypothetical protein